MTFAPCFGEGGTLSTVEASHPPAGKSGREWSKSSRNAGKFGISDDCAVRVVDFLTARHPIKPAEAIEAETGIPSATARKWLSGSSRPSFVACLTLIRVYGPEFLTAAMESPPAWISRAASAADAERTRAQIEALQRRLDRHLSEVRP